MQNSGPRISRLALFSLTISLLWIVVAMVVASSLFWYPWRDPQGWDKLIVFVILFWGTIITALLSTATGLAALLRTRKSQGQSVGRYIAIAGMGLAALVAGFLAWSLWGGFG